MAFDIRRAFDEAEEYDEEAVEEYTEELFARFVGSPEARALDDDEDDFDGFYWANPFIQYGIDYGAGTPPEMSAADVEHVLFTIFPRKVSVDSEKAEDIVLELRAFWRFLRREFKLENADECLAVLGDAAIPKLERRLADPSNFGMAKSVFAMGKAQGFDVETEEGLQAWMKEVNANPERYPLPGPGLPPSDADFEAPAAGSTDEDSAKLKKMRAERKRKKKQAKATRRRNR